MFIIENYVLPIILLIGISWAWDVTSRKAVPAFKISKDELKAMSYASEIYEDTSESIEIKGVGEVHLYESDKSTSYLVFRGTNPFSFELFKNIHLKSFLILLSFSVIMAIIVGFLPEAGSYKKVWFGLTGVILFFLNSLPISSVQTKYEDTSKQLLEKLCGNKGLANYLKEKGIKHLYIAGHSKGGAEATIIYTRFKHELEKNNIKSNLVTIGAASSQVRHTEDYDSVNFVFKTDTVQLLNMNKYRGRVLERNPDGLFYFLCKIITPMLFFGFLFYFTQVGLASIFNNIPILKHVLLGAVLPVYVIALQLVLTHGHVKYVEHAKLYLIN